jgi:hypothetical protein
MMIVEAVSSAPSPPAVFFLVTAYLESLRHFERTCGVPPRALELPVAGAGDLDERVQALRSAGEESVAVSEVCAVLACALARLDELGESAHESARIAPPSRSDKQQSSMSA